MRTSPGHVPPYRLRRMDQMTFEMAVRRVATASSKGASTTIIGDYSCELPNHISHV